MLYALFVLIGVSFIGFALGQDWEKAKHREYCDCKSCSAWRKDLEMLAEKKTE